MLSSARRSDGVRWIVTLSIPLGARYISPFFIGLDTNPLTLGLLEEPLCVLVHVYPLNLVADKGQHYR